MPKPKRNWVIWVLLVVLLLTMAIGSYYIQNVQHARLQQQQKQQPASVGRESKAVQSARRELTRAGISTKRVSTAQMQRVMNAAEHADESVVTYAKKHPNTLN
ncbi:hypothetical protein D3P96_05880 [Weissella viridescens]|uniref:Uncharacterized protein n=1 Tax=Weissella viridescens TaxID=1629 RepID=A0A3P2RAW1_WEIVI|nr:hypothetical protein [Weissella viridescens]RRG17683.1 hypothetical protein D3P96_05880 [Weissella viridescens]